MRILHICLSNWYVDKVGYQENELIRQHVSQGHTVLVIASTETHSDAGKLVYVEPATYLGSEGAKVIRIPYLKYLPHWMMRKLRIHSGLYQLISDFEPDTILFHGTCGWELLTVSKFIDNNPSKTLYVDSHEDQYNSGRSWLSKEILHKLYYAFILRKSLPQITKILCYSLDCINFVNQTYKVPLDNLELYPLGGIPIAIEEYLQRRSTSRLELNIANDEIILLQSGKQSRRKRVLDSIRLVSKLHKQKVHLLIVGVIHEEIADEFKKLVSNSQNVSFLGWKDLDQLTSLLCAADVYLQPGVGIQSVTMQHSLCCHCAVILDDILSHRYYVRDNGWLIGRDGTLEDILDMISFAKLEDMKASSFKFALENLNYEMLAQRILTNDTH